MTMAEPLQAPVDGAGAANDENTQTEATNLRDAVSASVRQYLSELDGQLSTDVYQMVLAEIEAPLLEEIMAVLPASELRKVHENDRGVLPLVAAAIELVGWAETALDGASAHLEVQGRKGAVQHAAKCVRGEEFVPAGNRVAQHENAHRLAPARAVVRKVVQAPREVLDVRACVRGEARGGKAAGRGRRRVLAAGECRYAAQAWHNTKWTLVQSASLAQAR